MLDAPNIASLLRRAARCSEDTGIITYPAGKTTKGLKTSYAELLQQAERNAQVISAIPGFKHKSIVLIHLDDHLDNINLFWAVVLARGIPCMSTPFTNIPAQRGSHIRHLATLLNSPICITREHLLPLFEGQSHLTPYTIEGLRKFELPKRTKIPANTTPRTLVNGQVDSPTSLNRDAERVVEGLSKPNGAPYLRTSDDLADAKVTVNGTDPINGTARTGGSAVIDGAAPIIGATGINGTGCIDRVEQTTEDVSVNSAAPLNKAVNLNGDAKDDAPLHVDLRYQEESRSEVAVAADIPLPMHLDDLALLMLTSGSTGNAKAVRLTHAQMIMAVAAKCQARPLPPGSPFLNWIGFDHVACMTEIHLQAMYLCVGQVHVQASDIVSSPGLFLRLLSEHRIGKTFAPNFYLALVKKFLETKEGQTLGSSLDLISLRWLASGGEPNVVETCSALAKMLEGYGATHDVIMPGFGMTETCAGSIWNTNFPEHDIQRVHQFASLGKCQPGIEMRVITEEDGAVTVAQAGEAGFLEIRGPIVFQGYFNNPEATSEAISPGGWFRTGDQALIDPEGNLNLIGRNNDHININGVKYLPVELDAAIDGLEIPGVTSNYTVSFSIRPSSSQTEQVCVVYLPSYPPDDIDARIIARECITKAVRLHTGSQPKVLPLNETFLMKSTLGKLSRVKIRTSYERGEFQTLEDFDAEQIRAHTARTFAQPATPTEHIVRDLFSSVVDIPFPEFGVETPVFEMGITSIHLIQLKKQLQTHLSIPDIPISVIMTNPTIRSLCRALADLDVPKPYDPVVVLQAPREGNKAKTPIWLFHPGVGEVLVFLSLAKYLHDGPVYALRARGFEAGHTPFTSIREAVSTYHTAIKSRQPRGPYALAGYSYGTMLAFETAKLLQADGDQIAFLGSLNLPPHIKDRMRQLDWSDCLLHLCYFLSLVPPNLADDLSAQYRSYTKAEAMAQVLRLVDQARLSELALSSEALCKWADLSYGLQSMARSYEPRGRVPVMDVFVAEPLNVVAENKEAWVRDRLSKWADFCESEVRFHDVEGEHYTMIGDKHVLSFQRRFRKALEERGL